MRRRSLSETLRKSMLEVRDGYAKFLPVSIRQMLRALGYTRGAIGRGGIHLTEEGELALDAAGKVRNRWRSVTSKRLRAVDGRLQAKVPHYVPGSVFRVGNSKQISCFIRCSCGKLQPTYSHCAWEVKVCSACRRKREAEYMYKYRHRGVGSKRGGEHVDAAAGEVRAAHHEAGESGDPVPGNEG